jgi:hypothetical protein
MFAMKRWRVCFRDLALCFALALALSLLAGCERAPAPRTEAEPPPPPVGDRSPASEPSVDDLLAKLHVGNLAFNTPDSMGYGETRVIHLVMDGTKTVAQLESTIEEAGPKVGAEVKMADRMEAHLTGAGFEITPITSETQPVSLKETTDWKWDVRPKAFGEQSLHLAVNALLKVDGEDATRAIQTFDKDIRVTVSWPATLIAYPQDHWEIATAIGAGVVGFGGWLFGLRKKKDKA